MQESGRGMKGGGSRGKGRMAGKTGMENRGNSRKAVSDKDVKQLNFTRAAQTSCENIARCIENSRYDTEL